MRWVTREHPRTDRVACPWLIGRFIDAAAEFVFVPAGEVLADAAREGATSFDDPWATTLRQHDSGREAAAGSRPPEWECMKRR